MARRRVIVWGLLAALLLAGVVYESVRRRPALVEGVQSQPPSSTNETARLEKGFSWSASRQGRHLFDLLAQTLVGLQGGTSIVREVKNFTIYTEDGKPVGIEAERGQIQQKGTHNQQDLEGSLEGNVVVHSPTGMVLETAKLTFDTATRRLVSPGPATVTGDAIVARLAGFVYTPDRKVVDAQGPIELDLGRGSVWRIDTGRAQYHVGPGQLALETPFRARQPDRTLVAGPAQITMPVAPLPARLRAEGPALLKGVSTLTAWQLAAGSLDAEGSLPKGGPALVKSVVLGPPSSLAVLRGTGGELSRGEMHAERWKLDADPAGKITGALAGPGFDGRWTGPKDVGAWALAGQWLDLRQGPAGGLEHAEARGRVVVGGPQNAQADAEQLVWDARRPGEVVLTGDKARARQGGDTVEAPKLTILRDKRVLIAEPNPLTEAASLREGALFRDEEPVRVSSSRVTFAADNGPIDFEGPVQAWQQDTNLRAKKMRLLRAESRLVADGDVAITMTLGEPGKENRRRGHLLAQHVEYFNETRIAVLTGGATYEEPETKVDAEQMRVRIRKEGGVDSLTATGSVKLAVQGNAGTADRLEWTGGKEGIVTLFGDTSLATLETQNPGSGRQRAEASRLSYDLKAQKGVAEGRGGRTVLEGTPPPQKPK